MAEATALGAVQCEFESRRPHFDPGGDRGMCVSGPRVRRRMCAAMPDRPAPAAIRS